MTRKKMGTNAAAWLISVGLILFVVYTQFSGDLWVNLLPAWIGLFSLIMGCLVVINKKTDWQELWHDKRFWLMSVIAACISASGIEGYIEKRLTIDLAIGAIGTSLLLLGLFIAAREKGWQIIKRGWFKWVVILESISLIVVAGLRGWSPNGGLVSITNYDIATGVVVFGILLSEKKDWIWLSLVGAIGILFSGSGEAIFVGMVAFVCALVTNWNNESRKNALIVISVALVAIAGIASVTGVLDKVQAPMVQRVELLTGNDNGGQWVAGNAQSSSLIAKLTGYRLGGNWQLSPIKPFGYGINLTHFYVGIPHNVALIIIEQCGVLALVAWLSVVILGMKNREMKYVWIMFVSLGVLDHFVWTQGAPWYWVLAGLSFPKREVV